MRPMSRSIFSHYVAKRLLGMKKFPVLPGVAKTDCGKHTDHSTTQVPKNLISIQLRTINSQQK